MENQMVRAAPKPQSDVTLDCSLLSAKAESVSVAMCTFNGAKFLNDQLKSIAAQTRKPDEMIICDDGSQDSTREMLARFAAEAPFLVKLFYNETRMGSTANFAKAISLCSGKIIVLSDQDDVWMPQKINRVLSALASGAAAVFSDATVVDEDLVDLKYSLWEAVHFTPELQRQFISGRYLEVLLRCNVVTGATLAFRSELRDKILPIPSNWIHDGWIALIISTLEKIAVISDPLIQYRQHSENQVGAQKRRVLQSILPRKDAQSYFEMIECQYREVRQRLVERGILDVRTEGLLDEKVAHMLVRRSISGSARLSRLGRVLNEALTGRYWRFSNGWRSVLRDLVV